MSEQWVTGTGSAPGQILRIYATPTVSRIFPSTGPASNPMPISVHGATFEALPALRCVYNGTTTLQATVVNSTLIRCEAPSTGLFRAGDEHSVQITPDGEVISDAAFTFAYYGASQVVPASGPVAGGTRMTLHGPHLSGESRAGVLCRLENGSGERMVVSGSVMASIERGASVRSGARSVLLCVLPSPMPALWHPASGSSGALTVSISLHGMDGFAAGGDAVGFRLYHDPQVGPVTPSFASTGESGLLPQAQCRIAASALIKTRSPLALRTRAQAWSRCPLIIK